jgi:predicted transcriptional regulator
MEYAPDEGKGWRRNLQQWLESRFGCVVFNPNVESEKALRRLGAGSNFREMKHTDPQRYREIVARLVDLDCHEIAERSDIVLCYWDESAMKGAGTKGELTIARYSAKAVFMVTEVPLSDIPGWVLGCTTRVFESFDQLKAFLASPGT